MIQRMLTYNLFLNVLTLLILHNFRIPNTGSIKMIDVWKMISLMFPFVEIILHSILHVLKQLDKDQSMVLPMNSDLETTKNGYEKASKIVKKMAIYGLPITYIIFLVGYMIYPTIL